MKSSTALPAGPWHVLRLSTRFGMRGTPMLVCAIGFAGGIALMQWRWVTPAVLLYSLLICAGVTLAAMRRASRWMLLPLLVMWCALGWLAAELEPAAVTQSPLLKYIDGLNLHITGTIERITPLRDEASPVADAPVLHPVLLDVHLHEIEDVSGDVGRMTPVDGGIRLTVYETAAAPMPQWQCGEEISTSAILHNPQSFFNPGAWDYAGYLAQQGVVLRASVHPDAVFADGTPVKGRHWVCRIHAAQTWASERLTRYVASRANLSLPAALQIHSEDAGALAAMLFGDRTQMDRTLKSNFVSTGSFHLFVVSGLHIALLAGLIFFLLRRLRVPERWAMLLMLISTTAYALLTGFGEPVQRAVAMTALFVAARLLWRQTPALNVLGTVAMVLLVASPRLLFDASFQMTVIAVLAIAGIAAPLGEGGILAYARATRQLDLIERDEGMPAKLAQFRVVLRLVEAHTAEALGRRWRRVPVTLTRWMLWAAETALVCVIAELAMALPMAVWFHRIPLLALPANLIAMPMLIVLAPLGMISFLAALISPWLAMVPMAATAAALHFAEWFAATLSHLHIAQLFFSQLRTPAPTTPAVLLALTMFLAAMFVVAKDWRGCRTLAVMLLFGSAMASVWPAPMVRVPERLEVTTIDVGQGDSIFVVTPDGHTLLVDAGGPIGGPFTHSDAEDGSMAFDIGEEVVSPYLWWRQVRRLDAVAVTHAHSDHIGGMPAVLRNFRPRELWLGGSLDAPEEKLMLETAAQLGITVRHWTVGEQFNFGGVPVRVLWPPPQKALTARSANNDSLVLELDYGASRALLEGDAEAPSENGMLASGELSPVTMLKVAHHGSRTSSTAAFLNAVVPATGTTRDAVISVGRDNPFGHPKQEVVDDLMAHNVHLYRTDTMGAVTVLMDAQGNSTASNFISH